MRYLITSILLTLACSTTFAHEITFTMNEKPMVVDADLVLNPGKANEKTVYGPWTFATLNVDNKSKHDITLHEMTATCAAGHESYTKNISMGYTVEMNSKVEITEYIDALPALESRKYECVVVLQWSGPHHRHLSSFNLLTE